MAVCYICVLYVEIFSNSGIERYVLADHQKAKTVSGLH